ILTYSRMVEESLKAAEALVEHGVEVEVVDLRTLAPLDVDTIATSVEKTGRVVVVEEGTFTGGVGAELVAQVVEHCFDYLQAPPKRVAAADCPVPSSRLLEQAVIPDYRAIAQGVAEVVAY
ncbi:MAG: transketolase C-terminal domain-containing protein, partial [Armatimonadota bacterium]